MSYCKRGPNDRQMAVYRVPTNFLLSVDVKQATHSKEMPVPLLQHAYIHTTHAILLDTNMLPK
jgi:hypothetical protein